MEALKEKNKQLLVIAICVAVVILIIGGITLILGLKNETKSDNGLKITYNDGEQIEVKSIEDGWESTKKITVSNKSGKTLKYDLVWNKATNTFKTQSDLLYSISSTGDGASELGTSQIPVAASPIFNDVSIDDGITHTYTVKIWYDKSNKDSNEKDSEFKGTLKIKTNTSK